MEELRKRMHDLSRHGKYSEAFVKQSVADVQAVSPDTPHVMQTVIQIEQAKTREKTQIRLSWSRRRKRIQLKK